MLNLFKKLTKRYRDYFGYTVRWVEKLRRWSPLHPGYGLNGLDKALIEEIPAAIPSYYVELGANDGVQQDNTLALELYFNWSGLLIEPVQSTFEKLNKNRSKRRNFLLRAAVSAPDYPKAEVEIINSGLMSIVPGLDGDIENPEAHAERGLLYLEPGFELKIESVRAMTLTEALVLAGAPSRIGLLSLDIEGGEMGALRGLCFEKFRPDFILVETRSFSEVSSFLEGKDYELVTRLSHHDWLFRAHSLEQSPV